MKRMVTLTATLIIAVLALASLAVADVPQMINYQGQLTNSSGDPLDTTVSMIFTIYDAATIGNSKWTETHPSVNVVSGLFNVLLGNGTPPVPIDDSVFNQPDRWLGIHVGADPELTPRTRLVSVGYSHRVSTVDGASGGVISGDVAIQSDLDVDGAINASTHYMLGGDRILEVTSRSNTFLGVDAGISNTTGLYNTFVGEEAGSLNETGNKNTYIGRDAGSNGGFSGLIVEENTCVGFSAGTGNFQGNDNTCIGSYAGYRNEASSNTFVGSRAGHENTTGWGNSFFGRIAGYENTTGQHNTFIGTSAGYHNTTGGKNTFVGKGAGYSDSTGGYNVYIGADAGFYNKTGEKNIYIGYRAGCNETDSNKLYIANGYIDSDVLIYGDFVTDMIGINTTSPTEELHVNGDICYTGTIGACSDVRYKKNIETVGDALETVLQLRGVTYNWKQHEYPDHKFDDQTHLGFVAQEMKEVLPQVVMEDGNGYMSVDYGRLTPVLVEAMKELKAENDDLRGQLTRLAAAVEVLLAEQSETTSGSDKLASNK